MPEFGVDAHLIQFAYRSPTMVLDNVSFNIRPGSIFAVIGPNGAGKTTLVKMLCGLRKPQAGTLMYHMLPNDAAVTPYLMRSHIAVVHQFAAFDLMLTLMTNLRIYPLLRKSPVQGMEEKVRSLAQALDLEGCLNRRVMELSGGQVRKAQLLRALLVEPSVLILDEPTTAVDALSRRHMWEIILELQSRRGTTVMWTTHDLQEVERRASEILILDRGRTVYLGPARELGSQFGAIVLEVAVTDPVTAVNLAKTLDSVLDVERLHGTMLHLVVKPDAVPAVFSALIAGGVAITSSTTRHMRLEEVIVMLSLRKGGRIAGNHDS